MKTNYRLITAVATILCGGLTGTLRAGPPIDAPEKTSEVTTPGQPTKFNRASKLIGMEVENEQGQKLGDIKDIVIDTDKGAVSYVVLSAGGVLGVGEKLLAVPLSAFSRSADQNHLVLQASKSNISQAAGLGATWPSIENPSFGAMPFWENPTNNVHGAKRYDESK